MNHENKKMITLCVITFIVCAIVFGVATYFIIDNHEKKETESLNGKTSEEIIEEVMQTPYISETCYDGSKIIDPSLYEKPFAISPNYHSNIALYNSMGEDFLTDKETIAMDYVTLLYNVNYNQLVKDPNKFIGAFDLLHDSNVLYTTDDADVTTNYYAEMTVDKYVQNKAQIEAEFITDKSLVFYNNGVIYVRGYLKYTVYAYDDLASLNEELKNDIQLGETYYLMSHVLLVASSDDSNTYKVIGLEY